MRWLASFAVHRRWAIRLFLAVSGVLVFQGRSVFSGFSSTTVPSGSTRTPLRARPSLSWDFAQYLLPLTVFEIYWRTQQRAGAAGRFAMAATLVLLTVAMAIGIFAHAMFAVSSGTAF